MLNKKSLSSFNIDPDNNELLNLWLDEINHNPRLKEESLPQRSDLKSHSKHFLNTLLEGIKKPDFPELNSSMLGPVLSLWHALLAKQQNNGFSTRETALLIYALRTSLLKYTDQHCTNKQYDKLSDLNQLSQLLDLLGMLTFEIYQSEKDSVIQRQSEQIHYLQKHSFQDEIIGNSLVMQELFQTIGLVLENDITVLLEGESGTGKDLIASIIHKHSKRKKNPFITLNCASIPKDLIESELFGHEKGAFTSAEKQRLGKFELAQNGTIFLDEIAELPLDMQAKLLRVIQNREIERIGSEQKIPINVRIIAATHANLKKRVDEGKFRLDLFYRLHVFPIHIPPLNKRKDDILLLANYFIKHYATVFSLKPSILSKDAKQFLLNHSWPGNIRELENTIQRSLILAQGKPITSAILDYTPAKETLLLTSSKVQNSETLFDTLSQIEPLEKLENLYINWALERCNHNISSCAKALGLSRTTLYNKLQKTNIKY